MLDMDIQYFWSTKITGAVVLFILNRYLILVGLGFLMIIGLSLPSIDEKVRHRNSVAYDIMTHDSATGVRLRLIYEGMILKLS